MAGVGEGFAELLGRSCFSFLEGASHPDELVRRAKELDLEAIALCDRDGLYGVVRAWAEGNEVGLRVVVGAELTLEGPGASGSVALLARDRDGYASLCRLLTKAHAEHEKGTAGIGLDALAADARGLVAIRPIDAADVEGSSTAVLATLRDVFADRAFVAAWRHLVPGDAARLAAADAIEARYGLAPIATARALYHHGSRKALSDVLHCIRHKTTLDRAGTALSPNAEARLRSAAEMQALFRDRPEWVSRTVDVARDCQFSLSEIRYRFPSETLVLPGETPDEALRRAVEIGCRDRYPEGTPPAVHAQIEKELALIARIDVAPYFLSVQQIVNMARRRRILCQGRGSAANSAVCFVLGITAVDPARSSLLFERFLSEERAEPPDIDVDFEHERREEVIQEIYETYGRDRAAMVSEIIAYRGKSAVREVGKVFGLSLDQVGLLSGLVTHWDMGDLTERRVAEAGLDPKDGRLRQVLLLASSLEGFPRHLSIHVGGFVLSAEPLHHVAPIEPARMEGRTVIPWDKDDLDDLGFFKVDVLALGMLTAIRKTLGHLTPNPLSLKGEGVGGEGFDPIAALASIPPEDPAVYDAVSHADTVGVFQIESRAQMAMLPRLRPRCFYDLVIEVAIVRPGPIQGGMVHPYLRRRTGEEAPISPHPCLDGILSRTLGVPLFQEQVMQIAMTGAGYSAGEADQLRRDMAAWKKHGRLERHRDRLLEGFAKRGISADFGEKLYQQIQGFGEYGFPESHAASFALLVYASSWLKVHHPVEFCCAILNSQPMGFYSASSLVRDLQAHGGEVRPVCVMHSRWDSTLEPADMSGALPGEDRWPFAMRLGLRQVRGLGQASALAIEGARAERPFEHLDDFVRRTRLPKDDVEALAEAGAFVELVPGRRDALWKSRAPRLPGLFEGVPLEAGDDPKLAPLRPVEQLVLDYGRVGLSLGDHPMRHVRARLASPAKGRPRVRLTKDLATMRDKAQVAVAGLVIGRQRPATASGVTFITLEDESGVANLVVQKRVFDEHYVVARHAKILLVHGRVERQGEVVHVLVRRMDRLDLPGGEPLVAPSRDFH
jgi:error-prone DNA polymerase